MQTSNRASRGARALGVACILALGVQAGPARAQDEAIASEGGWGALSAISTLVYGPVKVVYATLGLIFGGAAWGLSGGDSEVMAAVVTPAIRGDYVVTPAHLRMERTLEFFGRDPRYRPSQVVEDSF